MKITIIRTTCESKVSPNCTITFDRPIQRGRPAKNCPACREHKVAVVANKATVNRDRVCECGTKFTVSAGRGKKHTKCESCRMPVTQANLNRTCGCGKTFTVTAGKGRKATKCDDCKENGTVYRTDDDGRVQAIRKATLDAEARERKQVAGRATAERLIAMMGPLMRKTDRKVIEH